MKAIMIASSLREGRRELKHGVLGRAELVEIVTPRSPHRARGWTADVIYLTSGAMDLKPDVRERLMAEVRPCLATSPHPLHSSPDCSEGKHRACNGGAWCGCDELETDCSCECHA